MTKYTNIPPFMEEGLNNFKKFNFPGVDMETLLKSYQRNVEFMNDTQQVIAESTQSLLGLHKQFLMEAFEKWNEQVANAFSASSPADKVTQQTEASKAAMERMVEHAQNLQSTVEESNKKLVDSLQKRFKDSVDESVNLAKKSKKKS
ncbi:MAG: phasin family protein [Alphaproteobacteria bacterium]|nr:phasin family protein [Alphaproteobacteria bacterium]